MAPPRTTLTPLQTRLAACLCALAAAGVLIYALGAAAGARGAFAAELVGLERGGPDGDVEGLIQVEEGGWVLGARQDGGDGDGDGDRGGRELSFTGNNVGNAADVGAGRTDVWRYPVEFLRADLLGRGPGLPENVSLAEGGGGEGVGVEGKLEGLKGQLDGLEGHLEERQDGGVDEDADSGEPRTIYVSINTCVQPDYVGSGTQEAPPPQLTLYVSTTSDNESPGPDAEGSQQVVPLDGGFARATVEANGEWYMAVHAPDLDDDFENNWNYELAVSIDDYFHAAERDVAHLHWVDSDTTGALLITGNLTQANKSQPSYEEWMALTAPYTVFASNVNHTLTMGLQNSYCGLSRASQYAGKQDDPNGTDTTVRMSMITRGIGEKPKEQFHLNGLNASSTYAATLALPGNSTASGANVVGGGGKVHPAITFDTKASPNCALLYGLDFCTDVAYAVPSAPDIAANFTHLQQLYDNHTTFFYTFFNYSLQQTPCHIAAEGQYSLARTCTDCERAYKEWLCAVSIPRCEDFSNPAPYLQIRNVGQPFPGNTSLLPDTILNQPYVPMPSAPTLEGTSAFDQTLLSSFATNSSRNPMIDAEIKPGPYKEVLPCEDLCFDLMRSCPATLMFGCPFPGRGLEVSYGKRRQGEITCNYMGAYKEEGKGRRVVGGWRRVVAVAMVVVGWGALL